MYQKFIYLFIFSFFLFSCSKNEIENTSPADKEQSFIIYKEGVTSLKDGEYFYASKKFSEAEVILPTVEMAAKASLMSSYCLYLINFYDEALLNLQAFIKNYPADKNIPYAYYLIAISSYEQILDEKKDIGALQNSQKKINEFLIKFPNTEYALDLSFKLDLINNQLAAKELYVAKYYINTQKWIPAINRLRNIVDDYSETVFIEEALHRLVEVYYKVGLTDEANAAASLLGYNYNSGEWYKQSYKVLNKKYKINNKPPKKKDLGLIQRTIKKILK
jgi:outer membrane protein assembly factor BamD